MDLNINCMHFDGYRPCKYLVSGATDDCSSCQFFRPSPTMRMLAVHLGAAGDIIRCLTLYEELSKHGELHLLHDCPELDFILDGCSFTSHVMRSIESIAYMHNMEWDIVYCLDKSHIGIALATQFRKVTTLYRGWITTGSGKIVPSSSSFEALWHLGAEGADRYEIEKSYQAMLADAIGLEIEQGYPDMSRFVNHVPKKSVLLCTMASDRLFKRWHGWNQVHVALQDMGYTVDHQQLYETLEMFARNLALHEMVITMDSLPMHLALLFRLKTIALFGSTPSSLIDFMGVGIGLEPRSDCKYCYLPTCKHSRSCFDTITPDDVLHAVEQLNGS